MLGEDQGRVGAAEAERVGGGDLGLGPLLRLGRGEDQTGGRTRESILATALEAILGAIYLESGLPAVRDVVANLAGWRQC